MVAGGRHRPNARATWPPSGGRTRCPMLRRALREQGLRGYRTDYGRAPRRPDVAFTKRRLAIFVDGGLWHGHPKKFTTRMDGAAPLGLRGPSRSDRSG